MGFKLLFRGCPSTEPPHRASGCPKPLTLRTPKRLIATPPLRFSPLQRFPTRSSGMLVALASPDRLRLQVFSTS
jgi:hypothetical protein